MLTHELRARIVDSAIIPSIRTSSPDDARFAAETVAAAGIPIIEITMTVTHAVDVIRALTHHNPTLIVGAGTVFDVDIARQCVDAGARFVTSPGLDLTIVDFARKHEVLAIPGALTPTEITAAWKSGADFIKVFPCAQVGGASYIHAMKGPFPDALFVAAGGVNQQTASEFILAGAAAIGVGAELIPKKAVEHRDNHWITELARRFMNTVHDARTRVASSPKRTDRR